MATGNSQEMARNVGRANTAQVIRGALGYLECCLCLLAPPPAERAKTAWYIDGSPVWVTCVEHFIAEFNAALQYEFRYPVKWSATLTLKPEDFSQFLDKSFMTKWSQKEKEYNTPVAARLYCKQAGCEAFLGSKSALLFGTVQCKCGTCCSFCGKIAGEHECVSDDMLIAEKNPPGTKTTRCGCHALVMLGDGCNLTSCPICSREMCWVCLALDISHEHFSRARNANACPRFGQPGVGNPLFNEDIGEDFADI